MASRSWAWPLLVLLLVCALPHASESLPRKDIYVLWTYTTRITDFGFSFGADRARVDLETSFLEEYGTNYFKDFIIHTTPQIKTQLL